MEHNKTLLQQLHEANERIKEMEREKELFFAYLEGLEDREFEFLSIRDHYVNFQREVTLFKTK